MEHSCSSRLGWSPKRLWLEEAARSASRLCLRTLSQLNRQPCAGDRGTALRRQRNRPCSQTDHRSRARSSADRRGGLLHWRYPMRTSNNQWIVARQAKALLAKRLPGSRRGSVRHHLVRGRSHRDIHLATLARCSRTVGVHPPTLVLGRTDRPIRARHAIPTLADRPGPHHEPGP